jgi:hypothetical protein
MDREEYVGYLVAIAMNTHALARRVFGERIAPALWRNRGYPSNHWSTAGSATFMCDRELNVDIGNNLRWI